jgi:hypothetical protein
MLRRNGRRHRAIQRDLVPSARGILADPNTQGGATRDGQRVLPRGVRQPAFSRRLYVPGDLPAQVTWVRSHSLFAEQLAMQLHQLPCVHFGKLADIHFSILFWCFGHSTSLSVNY